MQYGTRQSVGRATQHPYPWSSVIYVESFNRPERTDWTDTDQALHGCTSQQPRIRNRKSSRRSVVSLRLASSSSSSRARSSFSRSRCSFSALAAARSCAFCAQSSCVKLQDVYPDTGAVRCASDGQEQGVSICTSCREPAAPCAERTDSATPCCRESDLVG